MSRTQHRPNGRIECCGWLVICVRAAASIARDTGGAFRRRRADAPPHCRMPAQGCARRDVWDLLHGPSGTRGLTWVTFR
jgi:hypothetical protein